MEAAIVLDSAIGFAERKRAQRQQLATRENAVMRSLALVGYSIFRLKYFNEMIP